jgi:5-methylthioadenosine/S-adenosylhomocysteine deaminase
MTTLSQLSIRGLAAGRPRDTVRVRLHGAIITPEDFYPEGTIEIVGDRIERVLPERAPPDSTALDVDCNGLLCPGFVDTHNHAPYAVFSRWRDPGRAFRSRFDWRGKTRCQVVVIPEPDPYYRNNISAPYKKITADSTALLELTLYGQVRGVIGGATTMVVDADLIPGKDKPELPGFSRDPTDWPGRVWGVLDPGCIDEARTKEILAELTNRKAKLFVHVGEGSDDFSRGEFFSLVARGLLTSETALIHAMALLNADWDLVRTSGASVIWSPRSNYRLYGRSIDIGYVIGRGINVALAPDWTVTGSSTVLDELHFVRSIYSWISDEMLLNMVTKNAAKIIGMPLLGSLAAGTLADVLVFPKDGVTNRSTAATRIVTSSHVDVKLALVGAVPIYGVEDLMNQFDNHYPAAEPIEIQSATGPVARLLRMAESRSFGDTVSSLSARLAMVNLTIAPLWEPD